MGQLEYPERISEASHMELYPQNYVGGDVNPFQHLGIICLPICDNIGEIISNDYEMTADATDIMSALSAALGQNITEMIGVLGRSESQKTGISNMNANINQMYKGSAPRAFAFRWVMSPNSETESKNIRQITQCLKYYTAPMVSDGTIYHRFLSDLTASALNGLADGANALSKATDYQKFDDGGKLARGLAKSAQDIKFLSSPPVWDINIRHNGNLLFVMDKCVCKSLNISYSEGAFRAFRNGTPEKITIEMQLEEKSFTTADKVLERFSRAMF